MKRRKRSAIGEAFTLAFAAGLILFAGWGFSHAVRAEQAYTPDNLIMGAADGVPANVIRLHIPANSDGRLDQEIKEEVRDALMTKFGEQMEGALDSEEAEKILLHALPEIAEMAETCLSNHNLKYGAEASIETLYFPEKTYDLSNGKTLYLPAGYYKALQVKLGEGQGKNWWCVMYPPLCYSDLVQRGVVPGVPASMQGVLKEVQGQPGLVVIDESKAEEVRVEVRSLILDAIKASITRIGQALSYLAGMADVPEPDME